MIGLQAEALRGEMNQIVENGQVVMKQAQEKIMGLLKEAEQNDARVTGQVALVNQIRDEVVKKVAELEANSQALAQQILSHEQVIEQAGAGSQVAHNRLDALTKELNEYAAKSAAAMDAMNHAAQTTREATLAEFSTWRNNVEAWYNGIKQKETFEGTGRTGGSGKGQSMDKKEISVWKLPEGELDKQSFRHWLDAVDQQLELVHGFKHAGFILSQVRRCKTE